LGKVKLGKSRGLNLVTDWTLDLYDDTREESCYYSFGCFV